MRKTFTGTVRYPIERKVHVTVFLPPLSHYPKLFHGTLSVPHFGMLVEEAVRSNSFIRAKTRRSWNRDEITTRGTELVSLLLCRGVSYRRKCTSSSLSRTFPCFPRPRRRFLLLAASLPLVAQDPCSHTTIKKKSISAVLFVVKATSNLSFNLFKVSLTYTMFRSSVSVLITKSSRVIFSFFFVVAMNTASRVVNVIDGDLTFRFFCFRRFSVHWLHWETAS